MTRSSQPNFYAIAADGSVTAVFPGGIQIPVPSVIPPPHESTVRWVRESDGSFIADISTAYFGGMQIHDIDSLTAVAGTDASTGRRAALALYSLILGPSFNAITSVTQGVDDGGGGTAQLITQTDNGVSPQTSVTANADDPGGTGLAAVTLIDGGGQSSFVQTPGTGPKVSILGGGNDKVTFPGGSVNSNVLTITHGLTDAFGTAYTPDAVTVTPLGVAGIPRVQSPTSTTFDVLIRTADGSTPAAGVQWFFYWIAFAKN